MKNNLLIFFVFLSQCQFISAQNKLEKAITGTVISGSSEVEGISVINGMNKLMTVTDKEGCFSILAKEGDILNFSGIGYKNLSKYVYKFEFDLAIIEVNMIFNSIELEEVVINKYANINAVNLGIISGGQIKLTQQERKLYSNSGGIMGLYNAISGDLKILKKNVEVEKKEILMKKIEFMFDDNYYIQRLKIPAELIRGFQYYCVEDSEFLQSVNLENKTKIMFIMSNLAFVYNKNRLGN